MTEGQDSYRVGVLGNCCTHGEFLVAALKSARRAALVGEDSDLVLPATMG